ncbi:MAG: NAD(P)/FAD-dependent oxidoreductase, partial [Bacteroidales bacterium]|nr:NAD(P)/FAD-dependent oxidoreductase [Bacteroidales bacterium]
FVTCGGVDLAAIDPSTMQCRSHPGLFFAGEVLDIDAITGGFNLQAAWSTAWLASRAIMNIQ